MKGVDFLNYPEDWPLLIAAAMTQAFGYHVAWGLEVRQEIDHGTERMTFMGSICSEWVQVRPPTTRYRVCAKKVVAYGKNPSKLYSTHVDVELLTEVELNEDIGSLRERAKMCNLYVEVKEGSLLCEV